MPDLGDAPTKAPPRKWMNLIGRIFFASRTFCLRGRAGIKTSFRWTSSQPGRRSPASSVRSQTRHKFCRAHVKGLPKQEGLQSAFICGLPPLPSAGQRQQPVTTHRATKRPHKHTFLGEQVTLGAPQSPATSQLTRPFHADNHRLFWN